ncbi:hypothetical protein GUJ93_ZPchr0012g22096 [Zizania palustris]|uniref:Uncharacterized protein n=1 Tax=Zizania palustris TaxID=103762 RepID=A0A8J5WMY0_ZIZPA|nr:hypothetical protein GUJ93_ZPchr0012g22096 [Zizania palustris]
MLCLHNHLLILPLPSLASRSIHLPFRHECLFSITRFAATGAAAGASAHLAPFAVEEYLVASCHLSPEQATKASKVISHLKSPSRPDAVLAFLSGLGLSNADIAATVAYDPRLLCTEVDRTLTPRLADLSDLGLSSSQIARLVLLDPARFRRPSVISKLQYYVPLFGSFEALLQVLKNNSYLLSSDLENVVKPNIATLRECGIRACDIAKLCHPLPRLISTNPERVRAMVAQAEDIGVPRSSRMFRHALQAVAFISKETITAKVESLKEAFGWSDAEVRTAVSKLPAVLRSSHDRMHRMSEFLISEVGLEPSYVANRPAMLTYSLERRLMPRYCVVKYLKANGLLEFDRSYYTAFQMTEKAFVEKYISPHSEAEPQLAEDYAAACRGKVPSRFRLQQEPKKAIQMRAVLDTE